MTFSAQEIQAQQFHVRFRGFDVEEVDDFLEKVASAFDEINDENQRLKTQLETLEQELATYHSQEKSFQSAMVAAQSIAEEMKEKSKKEAEDVLAAAREESQKFQEDAHAEVATLEKDLDRLKELKGKVQDDMRQLLNSYLAMLEAPAGEAAAAIVDEALPPLEPIAEAEEAAPSVMDETLLTPEAEAPVEEEEGDLSDLYVKIDLPDDFDAGDIPEAVDSPQDMELPPMPDSDLLNLTDDDDEEPAGIPDLEGDMVFTLEDPLDEEHEPSISFGEEQEEKKSELEDDFDPNESPL